MLSKTQFFKVLCGEYNLIRTVCNIEIKIFGRANFKRITNGEVEYSEEGHYHLNGVRYIFHQKRYIKFNEGVLFILNSERQVIHEFLLADTNILNHTHVCGEDKYEVTISLTDENLEIIYRVFGSKKNYITNTTLSKIR